jgi:endoglucanase
MSMPYVVGVNPNSPVNPHSALASGGTDINNIDTSPINETHILYGAVVGGPDQQDRFWDIRSDYPQTEVTLDYNAPMLTLAAISVLTQRNDPYYTKLKAGAYDAKRPQGRPCDAAIKDGCLFSGRMSKRNEIVMAVVVSVVGLVVVGSMAYLFLVVGRRRRA